MANKNALTEKQIKAASALARGLTRESAAKNAECGERTLYRWLERADFRRAVDVLRVAYLKSVEGALTYAARSSVDFLVDVMEGSVTGGDVSLRMKAATTLLRSSIGMTRAEERMQQSYSMISADELSTLMKAFTEEILTNVDTPTRLKIQAQLDDSTELHNPIPGSKSLTWKDLYRMG